MGLTPLLGASQSGCLDAVSILLRRGANVNHQHVTTKRTALMEASSREDSEIVRELLRHGTSP
jgi:ankyrin repeat protein